MEFLKNNKRLSFKYGGVCAFDLDYKVERSISGNTLTTVYTFSDGLKVTNVAKKIEDFNAYEWVNYFENTSAENSKIISELWDSDITLPWAHEERRGATPWSADPQKSMNIHATRGSASSEVDFSDVTTLVHPGDVRNYACHGGRSSDGFAPFFNINQQGLGLIYAIGWTGQWNARFERGTDSLRLMSKVEDTYFYLMPGEKIRGSSVTVMFYEGSAEDSQNKWRKLIAKEYSPTLDRVKNLPLCANLWGGTESEDAKKKIERFHKDGIPFEWIWMDAGWAGIDTKPSYDEFTGDWYMKVGDLRVSPLVHPNGLVDVTAAARELGYKFILWFEPERAKITAPLVSERPELFLESIYPNDTNRLLNIGDPEGYELLKKSVFSVIESLGIDCYRQDFNFEPLTFWRKNDAENRKGITEIKHVMALYRFFDEMLETFPNLIIDNCASGGRRLDMETTKRSFPLWRSDAQCPADPIPETTQVNNMNFSRWLPFTGTGCGRLYDTYSMRSAYAPGMGTNYAFSMSDKYGENEEDVTWLRERIHEYRRIRRYFFGDIYYLTMPDTTVSSWCAVEWNLSESDEGMVQVFKRAESPYTDATFRLKGIKENKTYVFKDVDGGEFTLSGKELAEEGLKLHIEGCRIAKIYTYKAM